MIIALAGMGCNKSEPRQLLGAVAAEQVKEPKDTESASIKIEGMGDYAFSGPASGETGRALLFRVSLKDEIHPTKEVRFTPTIASHDGAFSPECLILSDGVRSGSFSYTPTDWGKTWISMENDGGLRNPDQIFEFVVKVQLGSSGTAPAGNRAPDLGGFDFFAKGPWWQEMGRSVIADEVASDSDALLAGFGAATIRVDWETTTERGGNGLYGIPYNVVSGDQPRLPTTLTTYLKESDPGSIPFFPSMSIEGWYTSAHRPPTPGEIKGDHHALLARRNERTGGIDRLFEYYQVESADGGATWISVGGAQFDLTTGSPRPDGWTSSDAAGLPILPLLVHYDEAARGQINHPFRVAVSPGLSRNRFVWPARHTAYLGSPETGLPMGARLRLKQTWYDENRARFKPIPRTIIDTMRNHGVIVADLADGGFWLNGVNDERWDHDDLVALRGIPVSAFEVVDTIKSKISFTGPTKGSVGVPQTFTIHHLVPGDANFATNVYFFQSADGGKTWSVTGWASEALSLDDTHRSRLRVRFTPPKAGTYILKVKPYLDWIEPRPITFQAVAETRLRSAR